ncbi:hypothetical protein V8G54_006378 [Vigna mungo]|uniref:Uncharacterized protein n=1 Tax=Vigna mungo TaxID=3915 RepID=A0AAQ3P1F4_VIGMU
MYSFTVKPFFVPQFISSSSSSSSSTSTSSSSISLASFSSRSLSSISFPRNSKYRGRFGLKVEAYDSSNNDASNPASAGDSKPPNGTLSKSRREILLEYVKNVQPEFMELFVKRAPQQVVDAMRQTVTNMIGTLPPQFFAVTITTVAENLAQLMYSVIMTGYMFRNAQYRLELQEGLEQVAALPDVQDKKHGNNMINYSLQSTLTSRMLTQIIGYVLSWELWVKLHEHFDALMQVKANQLHTELHTIPEEKTMTELLARVKALVALITNGHSDVPDYAPGTQKNVSGEVIRWNNVSGPEKIDAKKYIELLEAEIEELNRQVGRQSSNAQNELLEYLKSLEPRNLKELTSSAGEDVVFAMNTFIKRLLAVSDPSQMKTSVTETSAAELAKLLYWLMVVGYSIRNIEVRFDMERVLGTSPKLAELPPGENV